MPPGSRNEKVSTQSGRDRISALADEAIHQVLGFLPAEEAVRTSVLARGWRHHWKSMHSLHITGNLGSRLSSLNRLVDRVLLNRNTPLEECHVSLKGLFDKVEDVDVDRWIQHSVSNCHVRVLLVDMEIGPKIDLSGKPMVSGYLKRLELHSLRAEDEVLDLSCCGVLEDLRLSSCDIVASKISSRSAKRVMISRCTFVRSGRRTCISAPNTISLKLDNNHHTTPLLECMPLLQNAFVRLFYFYGFFCRKSDDNFFNCGRCEDCSASEDHNDGYMLLGGLSSATHLELIAPIAKFTDWKCPTFDKLKILLLNEWCVTIDLGALLTILQHSPFLEKLTLQLNEGPKQTTLKEETYHTEKSSAISKFLNVVEIKCTKVNERVYKIIKMLSTFDLQINIMRTSRSSDSKLYFSPPWRSLSGAFTSGLLQKAEVITRSYTTTPYLSHTHTIIPQTHWSSAGYLYPPGYATINQLVQVFDLGYIL
ncbi:unnamed protein product [Alopecurus aequalis]